MVQLTLRDKFDAFNRVLGCRDTFLSHIVREALSLAQFRPWILVHLQHDIERLSREAKKNRLMDEIFLDEQVPQFPAFEDILEPSDFDSVAVWTCRLEDAGRPRAVNAELLLVLIVINGVFSLTSRQGYERLIDSEVFNAVLAGTGLDVPARSTVGKYLEIPSERTHKVIHKALYNKVRAEKLDDFSDLTVDSTAVEANSAWPTESRLIFGFSQRIHGLLERQADYTTVAYESKLVERWLEHLEKLHKEISLLPTKPGSRARRRKLYDSLLSVAEKTQKKLRELLDRRYESITDCCILPSRRVRVNLIMEQVQNSFDELGKAIASARRRVILGESVAASEKAFSLADPSAYMIEKGSRDPLLGYKPQIGRSGEGFISCFEVERGNPGDPTRLQPMVLQHDRQIGLIPLTVSTDDCYSSAPNLTALKEMGVHLVSFSGAKGKAVLGDEIWQLPEYENLRSDRSAVESTIFTLKHKCNMRRFCRHGLDGVKKDLSEAVLAYNLWRMAYVRRSKHERSHSLPKVA